MVRTGGNLGLTYGIGEFSPVMAVAGKFVGCCIIVALTSLLQAALVVRVATARLISFIIESFMRRWNSSAPGYNPENANNVEWTTNAG